MISNEVKNIALRLVAGGMPIKAAARACHVDRTTLKRWLSPEYAERRRQTYQKVIETNSAAMMARLKRERAANLAGTIRANEAAINSHTTTDNQST